MGCCKSKPIENKEKEESSNGENNLDTYLRPSGAVLTRISSRAQEVESWGDEKKGFQQLLINPKGVEFFMEFLRKEHNHENLLFLLECQKADKILNRQVVTNINEINQQLRSSSVLYLELENILKTEEQTENEDNTSDNGIKADKETSSSSSIESIPDINNGIGEEIHNADNKPLENKSTEDEKSTKSNFEFSFTGYESGDELSNDNLDESLNEISTEELIKATDENFNKETNDDLDEVSNQTLNRASTENHDDDDNHETPNDTKENVDLEDNYEIIEYKQTDKEKIQEFKALVEKIYTTFITNCSPLQINLDSKCQEQILSVRETPSW